VVAQAIGILVSPVLTRLYSASEFGIYALFSSSTAIIGVLGGARYEMAIVVPEKDQDAMNLVVLTTLIGLLLTGLLLVLVSVANVPVSNLLKASDLGPWLFAVPGFVFLNVCTLAFRYWFNRRRMYGHMASNALWRSMFTALLTVGFGYLGMVEHGLISGLLLGQIFTTVYFAYQLWREDEALVREVRWKDVKKIAQKYKDFPRFLIPAGFVESFSAQLPTFCLAAFFGQSIVGYFALATRVVNVPFGLVSASVGDVFRQQASETFAKTGNCRPLFLKCTRHLLSISVVPFGVLFITAPALFAWVFGAQWRPAGAYVQLMSVMFMVRFITSPLSAMFYVAEKQKWDLALQSALLTAIALTFYVLGQRKASTEAGILAYAIVYTAKYIVEYYLSFVFTIRKQSTLSWIPGIVPT
jgi:O-antigen/teichoic acid export membrane protein